MKFQEGELLKQLKPLEKMRAIAYYRRNFTLEQLKKAASNLLNSPFHTGKDSKRNPDNTWYATPEFILRNDEKVDEWLNKSTTAKPTLQIPEYLRNIPNSA